MHASKDRVLIFLSSALRSGAISFSGVILAFYLAERGLSVPAIGLVVSAGLLGSALATLAAVFLARRVEKRAMLLALAFLMASGGAALAFCDGASALAAVAAIGMVNGMGRDRGAGATIEQAILPNTVSHAQRTGVFAWYNVWVDSGTALGALLGALPALLRSHAGLLPQQSYQAAWLVYGAICLVSGCLVFWLSPEVEKGHEQPPGDLTHSRPIIWKFASLSALDSLGGGFLTTALISFWFFKRFGVDESVLGPLFFFSRIANIFSHLAAARIAGRIGLIKTMVYTHIPSSILLMTIPFMPNLAVAVIFFLLRESLVEMDVPTRQSYIAAVVRPHERVKAAGLTNLARGTAWGVGPALAGMMSAVSLSLPILVGPAIKIVYDVLLYKEFKKIKPPEEIEPQGEMA